MENIEKSTLNVSGDEVLVTPKPVTVQPFKMPVSELRTLLEATKAEAVRVLNKAQNDIERSTVTIEDCEARLAVLPQQIEQEQ